MVCCWGGTDSTGAPDWTVSDPFGSTVVSAPSCVVVGVVVVAGVVVVVGGAGVVTTGVVAAGGTGAVCVLVVSGLDLAVAVVVVSGSAGGAGCATGAGGATAITGCGRRTDATTATAGFGLTWWRVAWSTSTAPAVTIAAAASPVAALVATAVTVHGGLTPQGRPARLPGWLRDLATDEAGLTAQ